MKRQLHLKAFAKINLGLDVIRKRSDGYHEVRMIMQSVRLFDQLHMTLNSEGLIRLTSNLPFLPCDESNLVYRAIDLIRRECGIKEGLDVRIDKHIPVAAGLAGGSSDAAAALVGMNQLFSLGLTENKLKKLGVTLGADIPFCIMRGTALSEGIGEILTPLPPMPECYIVIVKPSFSMSTGFVYQNLNLDEVKHPDIDGMITAIHQRDLQGITSRMANVLGQVTSKHFPQIISIRRSLVSLGAMNSIMSGSGSTVFGVFDCEETARKAAGEIRKMRGVRMAVVVRPFNRRRIQEPLWSGAF